MDIRLLLSGVLAVIILLLLLRERSQGRRISRKLPPIHRWRHRVAIKEGHYPYHARTHLLTKSERLFFRSLHDAVSDRFILAVSVRLADVINCSRAAWSAGHGALISSKQLDFVLCEPDSFRIVLAIELDDETHGLADRMERDHFLDNAMRAAGVPLLRVPTASSYDIVALRHAIEETICSRTPRRQVA